MFTAYRLTLRIADHGAGVDAVGPLPYLPAVFAHKRFKHFGRNVPQGVNGGNSHRTECVVGLPADHGYLAYRQRIKKRMNPFPCHFPFAVRLCFSRRYFRYRLVYRKPYRYRETGLLYYVLPQLVRPFVAAVKAVHAGQINVMLVDRCFFIKGRSFGNYIRHHVRIIAVSLHVAPDYDRIGTKASGHFHRHCRTDAVFPGFIAAARYYTPVRQTSYYYRFSDKPAVAKPLDRYEECIHIEMKNISFRIACNEHCKMTFVLKSIRLTLTMRNFSEKYLHFPKTYYTFD